MAKKRALGIKFPLGGISREYSHQTQPPFTSIDCLNVRAIGMLEERERGGSRPGIARSHAEDIGGEIRLLSPMILALGDGFTSWSDTFSGTSLATAWSLPTNPWDGYTTVPSILEGALATVDFDAETGAAVAAAIANLDTSETYTVEMYCAPYSGAWHGVYTLYLRLDDTTPDISGVGTGEGVKITLTMTGTDGSYAATMVSYSGGVATATTPVSGTLDSTKAGYLSASVSGDTVTVYWGEAQIMTDTVDTHTGTRFGFALDCTVAGGVSMISVVRVQHFSTKLNQGTRSLLVASASGNLFKEETYGHLTQVTTDLSLRSDVILTAAQSGQILVIADYGDLAASGNGTVDNAAAVYTLDDDDISDWTDLDTPIDTDDMVVVITNPQGTAVAGTYQIASVAVGAVTLASDPGAGACSFRIERAPKVYDPSDDSFEILAATAGQTPTGCPLCTRYLDRIVFAGAEVAPHVYYMSRAGGHTDYDYSQTDSRAAVAGGVGNAGVPGEAITATVSHSDDYMLFGCRNQLWRMRGDPGFGGSLDAISYKVGIVGAKSWCIGPSGELIFLSLNGLYVLQPGGASYPIPISEARLPEEFQNIDPDIYTASMEFDVHDNGVHIFLVAEAANSTTHWWFDWKNKSYWPVSIAVGLEPTATCAYEAIAIEESGILIGGRDGRVRRFSRLTDLDDGVAFTNYVIIGPVRLAMEGGLGKIVQMDAVMAESSGDVTWTTYPALTMEATQNATASDTGTFSAGLNYTIRPAVRGAAFTLKLLGTAGRKWALEGIASVLSQVGKRRKA